MLQKRMKFIFFIVIVSYLSIAKQLKSRNWNKRKYPETIMIYLIPETEEQLLRQRWNRGETRQARAIS